METLIPTEIIFILDASGSMGTLRSDAIGGFNTLIEDQKKLPDPATMTFITFSHSRDNVEDCYDIIHDNVNLKDIPPLTGNSYKPDGGTALYDTIAAVVNHIRTRHDALDPDDMPERVFLVIMTDGEENSSRKHNKSDVAEMLKGVQDTHDWEVLYMGANQDAFLEASTIGVDQLSAMTYKGGSGSALRSACIGTSHALMSYRTTGAVDQGYRGLVETEDGDEGTIGTSDNNINRIFTTSATDPNDMDGSGGTQ